MSGVPPRGGEKSYSEYAMAQDLTVNVTIKGADKVKTEASEMTKSLNETGAAGEMAFSQLDGLLGGVPTKMKGAVGGIKKLSGGFKSLRAAIISTGIGALVVALTSLVTFFTKTQRGAEMLEKASAGLGAVMGVLIDGASAVGEFLVNAFTTPGFALNKLNSALTAVGDYIQTMLKVAVYPLRRAFLEIKKGGLSAAAALTDFFGGDASGLREDIEATSTDLKNLSDEITEDLGNLGEPFVAAAEGVRTFAATVVEAAEQGSKLAAASIALREAQRDLRVEMAESRRDIKAYNLIAEDTTKGFAERIEAAQKAIDIEKALMAERQRQAEEELRIHNEKMAMSESTEEDYEKQAELQARAFELQTESLELQTTLNNKLNTLEQQRTAELEAQEKARTEAKQKALEERLKLDELAAEAEKKLQADKEAAIASLTESARSGTFELLRSLTASAEKDNEESAKKAFERNKAISIAETLVSTFLAAQKAYASQLSVPTPDAPVRAQIAAGIAVASGLAKVAAIKSTQFKSTSATETETATGSIGGGQSVGVDVGTLVPTTQQATPEPVRAYVVSNEISNKQALDRELQIQTTL